MGARSWFASARRPRSAQNRARLVAARNSQGFAFCLRASCNAWWIEASPSASLFCARSTRPRLRWSSGFHWPSPVLATLCSTVVPHIFLQLNQFDLELYEFLDVVVILRVRGGHPRSSTARLLRSRSLTPSLRCQRVGVCAFSSCRPSPSYRDGGQVVFPRN